MATVNNLFQVLRIPYTPSSAVAAGDVVVSGSTVMYATEAIDANVAGSLVIAGFAEVVKEGAGSGQAWAFLDPIYYDAGNSRFTKTATGNTFAGYALAAALTAATSGRLMVNVLPKDVVAAVVAAPAAQTASAPAALSSSAPAALTYVDPAALTSPTAGTGSGADATTFSGAQCDALRADVVAIRTALLAAGVDLGALRTPLAAAVVDLGALRTPIAANVVDVGALRTTVANTLTSLKAVNLMASA